MGNPISPAIGTTLDDNFVYEAFSGFGPGKHEVVIDDVVKKFVGDRLKQVVTADGKTKGERMGGIAFSFEDPHSGVFLFFSSLSGQPLRRPICEMNDSSVILSRSIGHFGSFVEDFKEFANGKTKKALCDRYHGKEIVVQSWRIFVARPGEPLGVPTLLMKIDLKGKITEIPEKTLEVIKKSNPDIE